MSGTRKSASLTRALAFNARQEAFSREFSEPTTFPDRWLQSSGINTRATPYARR
jgi:hypothetical protein